MPETRKWLTPWGMDDNNNPKDQDDPEPPEPGPAADNKANTKKPPQYTLEFAEIIIPGEGLKEGQAYKFKGKVRRLDGAAPSNTSISVQSLYRYKNEEQICGNPEIAEINKDTLEFTGEFDELFEPNAYYLDKNKTPDSKFILILKLRGGCLDKDSFSSEVKLPMATKDYILKKGCYDEIWADAKKDDAAYQKSGHNYFPKDTVKKVQSLLIKLRFLNTGNDTGYYGEVTEAAIQEFQCASKGRKRSKENDGRIFFIGMNEITFKSADDGIYGPETEKEIAHWIQNNYTKSLERFVKGDIDQNGVRNGHGERGKENYHEQEQLTEAQDLFTQIGAYAGKRDGWFWDKMEAGIKWFQECAEKGEFVDASGKKVVLEEKERLKGHRPSPSVLDWVKISMARKIKAKGLKVPKNEIDFLFPLKVRPADSYHEEPRKYGSSREGRKHAGCDLIAPVGTDIFAVKDGTVLIDPLLFAGGTYELQIDHGDFIVRYCEMDNKCPAEIIKGAKVKQGQHIGKVGKFVTKKGTIMHMLHFEMYSGKKVGALTQLDNPPYMRRSDLLDPTKHLDNAPLQ